MEDIKLTYNDLAYYIVFANAILGLLFGTMPLVAGLLQGNRKLGFYGFLASIVSGAILGILLAYPVALLFLWLILRRRPSPPALAE